MKTKVYKLAFALTLVFGLLTFGCADLVVENLNEPDSTKALANPDDLASLAGGAFRTFHVSLQGGDGSHQGDGPAIAMSTMADQNSCPWGNFGMKDLSSEPRKGFVNSLTYAYFAVVRASWEDSYSAISAVNDVLKAIEDQGVELGEDGSDTEMVKAWCYFVSGIAHGYLGLIYDQGNVIKWDTDLETLELVPYQSLIDASLELLDQAITLADGNTFEIPAKWMGGDIYSHIELSELANSYAARILTYSSRNKAHNEALDWNRILTYTNNGINKNLEPELGDNYDFYDFYLVYLRYPGWG
ncbi:MAG: hypothetical protein HQ541_15030, partial [Mariniphaga sp.]|nr:hypothetical protein [Mariniphaga sp.]